MYSFCARRIQAAIKPHDAYEFFTYRAKKPVNLSFRGNDFPITNGTRFGVRRSANKKDIRLIVKDDPTRVVTLTMDQAKALAQGVGK